MKKTKMNMSGKNTNYDLNPRVLASEVLPCVKELVMLTEESSFNFKGTFFIAYMKAEYLLRATSRYTEKKN